MQFGPGFELLGVKIDTWQKYAGLQALLCVYQILDSMVQQFAHPILGFYIYNPDKKRITEFTMSELQSLAQAMYLFDDVKRLLMVYLSVTRFDIAVSRVVYEALAGIYTIRCLIREKEFVTESADSGDGSTEPLLSEV